MLFRFPIPLDRPAKTFFEVHQDFEAKILLRRGNISQRVHYVAGAGFFVLHCAFVTGDLFYSLEGLVQRNLLATGQVEHLACNRRSRSRAGQQVGGYHVVNVSEIAALLAITEDDRSLAAKHGGDELRNDSGVLRARVLSRAEDIEVAKRDRFYTVATKERLKVELAGELGHSIGRDWTWIHVFTLGQSRCVSISG